MAAQSLMHLKCLMFGKTVKLIQTSPTFCAPAHTHKNLQNKNPGILATLLLSHFVSDGSGCGGVRRKESQGKWPHHASRRRHHHQAVLQRTQGKHTSSSLATTNIKMLRSVKIFMDSRRFDCLIWQNLEYKLTITKKSYIP